VTKVHEYSVSMRILAQLGFHGLAWSLRRLHCPVSAPALVLDVGSGGNPYPRANVLLDAYEESPERYHSALVSDRPMVFGIIEKMPFKDKAFDFVIASHVLEHTSDPDAFLGELMRVGKAGYIETPDAFFERINPFRFHRLEVSKKDDSLEIFKKRSWRHDANVVDLYERQLKDEPFLRFTSKFPWPFYTRLYWSEKITYKVVNPDIDASWSLPKDDSYAAQPLSPTRRFSVRFARWLYSQRGRNAKLNIRELIVCPTCGSGGLSWSENNVRCLDCKISYPIRRGIPVMYPAA